MGSKLIMGHCYIKPNAWPPHFELFSAPTPLTPLAILKYMEKEQQIMHG